MTKRIHLAALLALAVRIAAQAPGPANPRPLPVLAAPDAAIFARDPVPAPPDRPAAPDSGASRLARCKLDLSIADSALRSARDTAEGLRARLGRGDSLRRLDSALAQRRFDSLRLLLAFDERAVLLDSSTASDTSLASLRALLLDGATRTGLATRRAPLLPGLPGCVVLSAARSTRGDTAWVRLVRRGLRDSVVVLDSIAGSDEAKRDRMERRAVRTLLGEAATPAEPPAPWPWQARAGALTAVLLLSLAAMASLW